METLAGADAINLREPTPLPSSNFPLVFMGGRNIDDESGW